MVAWYWVVVGAFGGAFLALMVVCLLNANEQDGDDDD